MADSGRSRGAGAPGLVSPDSERIRHLRQGKGWTQEDLANEAGRSKGSIEAIENAGRLGRRVQVRTLADIAAALEVSVESLLSPHPTNGATGPEDRTTAVEHALPLQIARPRARGRPAWGMACAALLTLGVAAWTFMGAPFATFLQGPPADPPLPDKPAVAILPFDRGSLPADQIYFSEGMIEELTTRLAKVPNLFVISPSTAATYEGAPVDPRRIGRELGVQYLVEGSVRTDGETLRVTARLVEARSGGTVWSDSYDVVHGNLLSVQARIAQSIVVAAKVQIEAADMARLLRNPTNSDSAHDAVLHALHHLGRGSRADHVLAREHLERALEIDRHYADAYAMLGAAAFIEYANLWNLDRAMLDRAAQLSQQALDLDRSNHQAYITLANTYLLWGRAADALAAAKKAVELDPNGEWAHATLGLAWLQNGRALAAVREMNLALRLNPRRPNGLLMPVAMVNFLVGRKERAARLWEEIRAANPDLIAPRIPLVTYYEKRGRHQEARAVAAEILAVNPAMTAQAAMDVFPGVTALIGAEETVQFRTRLRHAGLP